MQIRVAQTLAEDWVITTPNPEEEGWETELATFAMSVTAEGSTARNVMRRMIATIAIEFANGEYIKVESHKEAERGKMRAKIMNLGGGVWS